MLDCHQGSHGIISKLPLYIYIANISAKGVSLSKYMIVASAINAVIHTMHSQSDEPGTLDEPKLDYMIHANED